MSSASAPARSTCPWSSGSPLPLGTRPSHRRQGLAGALLQEGLSRVHALGSSTAIVTCAEGNLPSCSLYESVGFRADLRGVEDARVVIPGRAPAFTQQTHR